MVPIGKQVFRSNLQILGDQIIHEDGVSPENKRPEQTV